MKFREQRINLPSILASCAVLVTLGMPSTAAADEKVSGKVQVVQLLRYNTSSPELEVCLWNKTQTERNKFCQSTNGCGKIKTTGAADADAAHHISALATAAKLADRAVYMRTKDDCWIRSIVLK